MVPLRRTAVMIALLAGCTGQVMEPSAVGPGGPGDRPVRPGDDVVPPVDDGTCTTVGDPGDALLRRLTREQYDNTVRDLLGDTTAPGREFPPDETIGAFASGAAISLIQTEQYMAAAESLAANAVADLGTLLPCDPGATGEDACARQFITDFGEKAFRRPLETEEVDSLYGLYTDTKTLDGFGPAIEIVVNAMLMSPSFLYRVELGGASPVAEGVVPLTSYEIATRLSYLLWATMPDDELFRLAESDSLQDREVIAEQARRMLMDTRAEDATRGFFRQWLGLTEIDDLGKDEELFPEWSPALARKLRAEAMTFVDEVVWNGDGRFETLLTAPFTYGDEQIAAMYGVSGVTGTEMRRIELDPSERAGILTQLGVLAVNSNANQSSPVYRGKFVREQILCQHLPDPPDELMVVPPDPDPSLTTRERFQQHRTDPACSGCHSMMDPIGFGFENYDAVGQYRTEENGLAIDPTGELLMTSDADGEFVGAVELANRLAASEQARACFATQWFRFAMGRNESPVDDCALREVLDAFEASDGNVQETIVAITKTDAFRHRRVIVTGEVSP